MNSYESNPGEQNEEARPVHNPAPEQPVSPAPQSPYQGWQNGNVPPRQESPYANSPYAGSPYTQHPQQDAWGNPIYGAKPPKQKKPKGEHHWGKRILAVSLAVVLVAAGSGITALCLSNHFNTVMADMKQENQAQLSALQKEMEKHSAGIPGAPVAPGTAMNPSQVYAKNVGSVVAISSTMGQNALGQVAQGSGSGFILRSDGYVATNCHVVEGAASVSVITGDNKEYPAKVLGKDPSNDVAILKIEAEGLPAVTIGNSNDLLIGDMVVAIGNPLGELTATQTVGYICGKDRTVSTGGTPINMLQTDAAINPGNSGGPLFNMKGEVIGITTAKYSGTTGSGASIEGIGFAIPIDDVLGIMKDLAEHGFVTGPYLGVSVRDVDPQIASIYNIPLGAYIVEIVPDGSADRAGLEAKDIITHMGDYEIKNSNDLIRALRHYEIGDTVTVTYNRAGASRDCQLTLDEKPQQPAAPAQEEQVPPSANSGDYDEFHDFMDRFFSDFFGVPHP